LVGSFITNINVIIENNLILEFDIGLRKKNYSGNITNIFLENMITDIKDLFKESYSKYKLMHMLVKKYNIGNKDYYSLSDEIYSDEICLEIKLISIPNLIIFEIENILKKYQIKVDNYFDNKYLTDFFQEENLDISLMAYKLKKGINNNEVQITSKTDKNLGFFEKFFRFFG
uniref:hypothetical protein n=1 Tax=Candidatus Pelagibacter sp. HIMB1715 TaxID=3413369 RepID=UPI003F87399D